MKSTGIWTRGTRGTRGVALAVALAVTVTACEDDDDVVVDPTPSIVELASASPDLETLVAAVEAAELVGTLNGPGPFTVFAPTDAAFDGLDAGTLSALLEPANQAILAELLLGHVVAGEARASTLSDGDVLTTVSGDELRVTVEGGAVYIDGQPVLTADVEASNGVVHVIGGVLTGGLDLVERAVVTPDVSTLVTAVTEAGLVGTLQGAGPFTVFAPVNDAFAALDADALDRVLADPALLTKVLTYHVVPGKVLSSDLVDDAMVATVEGSELRIDLDGGATVNGIDIVATDIEVENGVIHLIDGVLLDHLDLVDVAVLNGFETLVAAVEQAGLTSALRDPSASLTVFAPTETAFAAVDPLPTGDVLSSVLLYHVLGSERVAGSLSDGDQLSTLQGGALTVDIAGGVVSLQGAQNSAGVAVTDVPARNGVIHVIDTVLLPPAN